MPLHKPKKPGFIRRSFCLLGRFFNGLRRLLLNLLLLIVVVAVILLLRQDLPHIPPKAALLINPTGILVDQRTYSDPVQVLLGASNQEEQEVLLTSLISTVRDAAHDPRISSIVLQLDQLAHADLSKLQEIAEALTTFRASDKKVYAIGDRYTQNAYWLATHADEIYLNPMGFVELKGYGVYRLYYKDALDKWNIDVDVFRVGEFKTAVEPFIRNSMSHDAKKANLSWLNTLWGQYTHTVAKQRDLPDNAVNNYIEQINQHLMQQNGNNAATALAMGWVDGLKTRDAINDYLIQAIGSNTKHDSYPFIHFHDYYHLRQIEKDKAQKKGPRIQRVGVIVAKGTIMDGKQPAGTIGGDSLARLIQSAQHDDSIHALVLRIDSGGGSAFASEIIRQALKTFQTTHKPLVVSMGSIAASGGYWIATPADEIWATPATLTGSIGIFGLYPSIHNALPPFGLHSDGLGTTALAGFMRIDRPLPPLAAGIIQASIDNGYQTFIDIVATGRDMDKTTVASIAQGRVWSGVDAKRLGLVDKLGTLHDAIASAAKLAQLEHYESFVIEAPLSLKEAFIRQLSSHTSSWLAPAGIKKSPWQTIATPAQEGLELIKTFNDPQGRYVRCMDCVAP